MRPRVSFRFRYFPWCKSVQRKGRHHDVDSLDDEIEEHWSHVIRVFKIIAVEQADIYTHKTSFRSTLDKSLINIASLLNIFIDLLRENYTIRSALREPI